MHVCVCVCACLRALCAEQGHGAEHEVNSQRKDGRAKIARETLDLEAKHEAQRTAQVAALREQLAARHRLLPDPKALPDIVSALCLCYPCALVLLQALPLQACSRWHELCVRSCGK